MKLLRVRDPKQPSQTTNKRNERKRAYPQAPNQRRASVTRDYGGQSQDIFPYPVHKNGSVASMTSPGGDVTIASHMTPFNNQHLAQPTRERPPPPLERVRSEDGMLLSNRMHAHDFSYPVAMQTPQQRGPVNQHSCPDSRPTLQRFPPPMTSSVPTLDLTRSDAHNDVGASRPFVMLQDRLNNIEVSSARETRTTAPKVTSRAIRQMHPFVVEQSHVMTMPSVTLSTPEERLLLQEPPCAPTEAEPHSNKRRCMDEQSSVATPGNFPADRFYNVIMEAVKRELLSAAEKLAVQAAQAVVRQISEESSEANRAVARHHADNNFTDTDRLMANKSFTGLNGHRAPEITNESYGLAGKRASDSRLVMDLDPIDDTTPKRPESITSNSPRCSLSPPSVHDEQTEALSLVTNHHLPVITPPRPTPPPTQESPVNLSHRRHSNDEFMLSRQPDYSVTPPFHSPRGPHVSGCGDGRRHHSDVTGMVSDTVEMCYRQQVAPRRMESGLPGNSLPERGVLEGHGREDLSPGANTQAPTSIQEALTPLHLKKAKLMFFFTRYPSTNTLKRIFNDVKFTRATTSQLIKWFSNFREFYYIQVEKFARQALTDGITEACRLQVSRDSEVFRVLNLHYNKNEDFVVPHEFDNAIHRSLQEFFTAIQRGKDRESSWKKSIYKVICKFDQPVPDAFKSPLFPASP